MNNNNDLIKNVNIQDIAEKGTKIYEEIKGQYESVNIGRFLAIEIESKKVYLGNTSAEAVELARQNHPDKVFYVVKIGFDVVETMARSYINDLI
ncbi:MAG: hypothetical protein V1686_02140 [Patescibacteria group bacterium]